MDVDLVVSNAFRYTEPIEEMKPVYPGRRMTDF
jgi:hypothetical protein